MVDLPKKRPPTPILPLPPRPEQQTKGEPRQKHPRIVCLLLPPDTKKSYTEFQISVAEALPKDTMWNIPIRVYVSVDHVPIQHESLYPVWISKGPSVVQLRFEDWVRFARTKRYKSIKNDFGFDARELKVEVRRVVGDVVPEPAESGDGEEYDFSDNESNGGDVEKYDTSDSESSGGSVTSESDECNEERENSEGSGDDDASDAGTKTAA